MRQQAVPGVVDVGERRRRALAAGVGAGIQGADRAEIRATKGYDRVRAAPGDATAPRQS